MKKERTKVKGKAKITKLKKNVKGITLIALVVTIIVLLILAGVAISLTIGQNGIFSRAQTAVNTWKNAETNEQLAMGEIEDWMDEYITKVIDGVIIPNGFYYVGGSKTTGLVISDNQDDEKEWNVETSTQPVSNNLKGNQFVWVPIENPDDYFIEETNGVKLCYTTKKTNVYSKLQTTDDLNYRVGKPGETDHIIREPDLLYYDEDYCDTLGYESIEEMAEDFVKKYKEMSDSIKKYKGFFIGRYELTGDIESPTEKKGEVLSCEKINGKWYDLYNICQNVVTGKEKVKSTMIYGVQWDATMDWLKETKFKDNPSKVDSDSSSWGNYSGSPKDTGTDSNYEANNIYDLAGNYAEWTQEVYAEDYRVSRGGGYDNSGNYAPAYDLRRRRPTCYGSSHFISSRTLYAIVAKNYIGIK